MKQNGFKLRDLEKLKRHSELLSASLIASSAPSLAGLSQVSQRNNKKGSALISGVGLQTSSGVLEEGNILTGVVLSLSLAHTHPLSLSFSYTHTCTHSFSKFVVSLFQICRLGSIKLVQSSFPFFFFPSKKNCFLKFVLAGWLKGLT